MRTEDIRCGSDGAGACLPAGDPSLSFEAGFRQLPLRDPDVWQLYSQRRTSRS